MIFQISKNNITNDFQHQHRFKKYVDETIIPTTALNGIKTWINDDTKFQQLTAVLTLEIDRSIDKIKIIPNAEKTSFKIVGKNTNHLLFGFGYYVREIAKGHIGWCVERVPDSWTIPSNTIEISPNKEYRLAYNFCTLSYTMAFWGKKEWETEVVRLAMLGFNMALIISGLPMLWKLVLEELNQSDTLIKNFIPDEAAWAWWAMGNLQQNDGVQLTDKRIAEDQKLAQFIVQKMREVGVEPVFPCFTGLMPYAIYEEKTLDKTEFRDQEFIDQKTWGGGYRCPALLVQTTESYKKIAKIWYKHLKTVYNTAVVLYLAGDIFHEGGTGEGINVADVAKSIQNEQQLAFPGVKWLLQCWQANKYQQTVFRAVDKNLTILQVLNCKMNKDWNDLTNSYYNDKNQDLPVIFCEVLNFGGNTGFYGGYELITNMSYAKLANKISENKISGFGMLSEGLNTNQIFYDAYTRLFYQDLENSTDSLANSNNLKAYVNNYTYSRYGLSTDTLTEKTILLLSTLQNVNKFQQGTNECLYSAKPGKYVKHTSQWSTADYLYYNTSSTIDALSSMYVQANINTRLWETETFRYDICDVARQVLADKSYDLIYNKGSYTDTSSAILSNIQLMDNLLATVNEWRLDYFESKVTEKAGDAGKQGFRRMITSWGKPGSGADNTLHDYAHRQYAGLMQYYYARWNEYFLNGTTNFTQITENFITANYSLSNLSEVSSNLSTHITTILTQLSALPQPESELYGK